MISLPMTLLTRILSSFVLGNVTQLGDKVVIGRQRIVRIPRMNCGMSHIEKEGTLRDIVCVNHLQRMLRYDFGCGVAMQIVGHIVALPHVQSPGTVLHRRVIVVVMSSRPEAHMATEAAIEWRVRSLPETQMPLAGYVRGVAAWKEINHLRRTALNPRD